VSPGNEQRPEDEDVADQPEQRDRDPGQLRELRRLHLVAATAARCADRLDARVVHVDQVGGDRDPSAAMAPIAILSLRSFTGAAS